MAKANPLRFSTKYQDDETDLVYYGYRYYNASTGSWLSRDLMEEDAAPNLYAFVENDPVSSIDPLGEISEKATVLGASWRFKGKHISAPRKKDRGKWTGTTIYGAFPWDVFITEKGCPPGKKQLRANATTYVVKYWYTDRSSQIYEEGNVGVIRDDWRTYGVSVNALGGCFCDSCAQIRLDLTKLYQAFYFAWASKDVLSREIQIMHLPRQTEYAAASQAAGTLQTAIEAKRRELAACTVEQQ